MKIPSGGGANRRQAERRETSLKARICYGVRDSVTLACTIRNISSGGALIELPEDVLLPSAFRLVNLGEGFAYDCRVVWRRGGSLGVAFGKISDLQAGGDPRARVLRKVLKKLGRG